MNVNEYTTKEEFIRKATREINAIESHPSQKVAQSQAAFLWADIEYVQEWDWSDAVQAEEVMAIARRTAAVLNGEQKESEGEAAQVAQPKEISAATVSVGAFSAEVTKGSHFSKYGKNWQYFDIDEGRQQSQIAVDLDTGKLVRGKCSAEFLASLLAAFNLIEAVTP